MTVWDQVVAGTVCDNPVSCQCLAVISFFKDPFLYLLGILIFPSHCFSTIDLNLKKKEAKALFGNRILMRRLGKEREVVEVFVPVWQKMENTEEEMWMCMGRREGEKRRKSYLKSQLGNHSSSRCGHSEINFQFQFPCLLCFKTLACCWRWWICQQLFV